MRIEEENKVSRNTWLEVDALEDREVFITVCEDSQGTRHGDESCIKLTRVQAQDLANALNAIVNGWNV